MIPRIASLKTQVDQRTRKPGEKYRSDNAESVLIQIGYNEARGDPEPVRWIKGQVTFFEESTIDIFPGEILAGAKVWFFFYAENGITTLRDYYTRYGNHE